MIASLFGKPERMIENSFVIRNLPDGNPKNLKILEIGGCQSTLSFSLARKGYEMVVIDVNYYPFTHRNLKSIQGNITEIDLAIEYFDCVLIVSVIEHIGLGWYGDSIRSDGDLITLQKAANAVKDQGSIIITTPIASTYSEIASRTRVYDSESLDTLAALSGLYIHTAEYYAPMKQVGRYSWGYKRINRDYILKGTYLNIHPYCTACLILKKQ